MQPREVYEKLNEQLCNQSKALQDLIWILDRNKKLPRPQNILLLGKFGAGKTTLVRETAKEMQIPLAEISGFYDSEICSYRSDEDNLPDVNNQKLELAINYLETQNQKSGIVLIHNMEKCFIYGGYSSLINLITTGLLKSGDYLYDISKVTFIGEVNTNLLEDCFPTNNSYTIEDFENGIDWDTKDEVRKFITNMMRIDIPENDEEEKLIEENELRIRIKEDFLSKTCMQVFNKRIFLEDVTLEDMKKVVASPFSLLRICNDLEEDYAKSDEFIHKVAKEVIQSSDALHDLDDVVRCVSMEDASKVKVYKDRSVLGVYGKTFRN